MKKSGILIATGPSLMLLGMYFSDTIARFLFGTESLIDSPGYADYSLTNRINTTLFFGGLVIFLAGIVFFFKELRKPVTNNKLEAVNVMLYLLGFAGFVYVTYAFVLVMLLSILLQ